MASFCIRLAGFYRVGNGYRSSQSNVPKADRAHTRLGMRVPSRVVTGLASAAGKGLDGTENHQANPEINQHSQIDLGRHVPGGRWKMRLQKEIEEIARKNCDQGLEEISHR